MRFGTQVLTYTHRVRTLTTGAASRGAPCQASFESSLPQGAATCQSLTSRWSGLTTTWRNCRLSCCHLNLSHRGQGFEGSLVRDWGRFVSWVFWETTSRASWVQCLPFILCHLTTTLFPLSDFSFVGLWKRDLRFRCSANRVSPSHILRRGQISDCCCSETVAKCPLCSCCPCTFGRSFRNLIAGTEASSSDSCSRHATCLFRLLLT